tara:strand:+ start:35494 stop:36600 length:1107 start_codon:yes stop_codon:yes gene_type:complete
MKKNKSNKYTNHTLIRKNILLWYDQNKRDLPWRKNKNPYRIWISEIMLQQTRVKFIQERYVSFLNRFPSIKVLANASIGEVLNEWQGIGYYSRARNLHLSAKIILTDYKGRIPIQQENLKKLPGIGNYTAAAIGSIAFDENIPALDANWIRVLSRILNFQGQIDTKKSLKYLEECANKIISKKRPGDFNQAVMDLGSEICKPKKIHCELCPIISNCLSNKNKTSLLIPKKKKKKERKLKTFFQFFAEYNGKFLMVKRRNKGLFKGLWELPGWEVEGHFLDCSQKQKKDKLGSFFVGKNISTKKIIEKKIHLTHVEILFVVFKVSVNSMDSKVSEGKWVEKDGLLEEGISSAQKKIIDYIQEQKKLFKI